MTRSSHSLLASLAAVLVACTATPPPSTPDSRSRAEGLAIPTREDLSRMAEIAARNAEADKPEAVVDWRADVPTTASETLIGEWHMRVLSRYVHLPERHGRMTITAIHNGIVEGRLVAGNGDGTFVDGKVREEDGKTILTFRTSRSSAWWAGVPDGEWIEHVAEFEDGRFTGEAWGEAGPARTSIGWYARRTNENDDLGAFLTWKNWMLKIVDAPAGFCEDRYRFFEDGTMTTWSGEEELKGKWRLDSDETGNLTLVKEVLATNGKPDCQGDTSSQIGDVREQYIVFRNGGGYMVCAGPDRGMSCYGTVNEYLVRPAPPDPVKRGR